MKRFVITFLCGIVLATILMCYVYITFKSTLRFDIELNTSLYPYRILLIRLGLVVALMMMRIKERQKLFKALPLLFGVKCGTMLSLFVKCYKIKGSLLFVGFILPHYIFYGICYIVVLKENVALQLKKKKMFKVLAMYCLGIFAEIYLNPRILLKSIDLLKI